MRNLLLAKYSLLIILISGALLLQCSEAKKKRGARSTAQFNVNPESDWDIEGDEYQVDPHVHQRIVRETKDEERYRLEEEEREEEEEEEEEAAAAEAAAAAAKKLKEAQKAAPSTTTSTVPPPNISIVPLNKSSNSSGPKTGGGNSTGSGPNRPPSGFPPPGFVFPPKPTVPGPTMPQAKAGEIYLPEGYNNLEIPKLNIGKALGLNILTPLPCLVFINIRSIRGIDELNEQITLEMDLVVEWIDGVLFDITKVKINKIPTQKILDPVFLKKIWKPDIYMDSLISVTQPKLIARPQTLKFSPETGFISYTTRVSMSVDCDMYFQYYPADTQKCEFILKSYSHFSSDLDLSWLKFGVFLQDPADPNFDIQVESADMLKVTQGFNNPRNETHDALHFTLLARRKLSFHLVQTYLPSVFFIVITWLCFLIPSRMVEARIGISMTTLLTLTSMFASVRESSPIVSYVKAIDIWMVACIFFVFLTLLEFAVLLWMRAVREEHEEKKMDYEKQASARSRDRGRGKSTDPHFSPPPHPKLHKYEMLGEATEKFAFLIFSIIFIVFNIGYWTWLLQSAEYFAWNVNTTHNAPLDD